MKCVIQRSNEQEIIGKLSCKLWKQNFDKDRKQIDVISLRGNRRVYSMYQLYLILFSTKFTFSDSQSMSLAYESWNWPNYDVVLHWNSVTDWLSVDRVSLAVLTVFTIQLLRDKAYTAEKAHIYLEHIINDKRE